MILLDTHAVLWLALAPEKLSRAARRAIERAAGSGGLAIASITLWEIATLVARRRIQTKRSVEEFLDDLCQTLRLAVLDITPAIAALAAGGAAGVSGDPADRIIAATARAHDLPLVTKDHALLESPLVRGIW